MIQRDGIITKHSRGFTGIQLYQSVLRSKTEMISNWIGSSGNEDLVCLCVYVIQHVQQPQWRKAWVKIWGESCVIISKTILFLFYIQTSDELVVRTYFFESVEYTNFGTICNGDVINVWYHFFIRLSLNHSNQMVGTRLLHLDNIIKVFGEDHTY